MASTLSDLQGELNRLAGTNGLAPQGAANVWAGTSGLGLVAALNIKAGNTTIAGYKGLNEVCNMIAGTVSLEAVGALQKMP
jgi:hypothetical protein